MKLKEQQLIEKDRMTGIGGQVVGADKVTESFSS
jgi:hypothetical protein